MNKKIAVLGDAMIDVYKEGTSKRLSPEAPVPIILNPEVTKFLGGAAHVVSWLHANQIGVDFYCGIGEDESGRELSSLLGEVCSLKAVSIPVTTTKTRIQVQGHQVCRIDNEFVHDYSSELIDQFEGKSHTYDAVIVSDYRKGAVSTIANIKHPYIFVDPKSSDLLDYSGAFLIKPNSLEFENLFGNRYSPSDHSFIVSKLNDALVENMLLTRGNLPAVLISRNGEVFEIPFDVTEVNDVTGAGDIVLAATVSCFLSGMSLFDAAKVGIEEAAKSVRHHGTGFGKGYIQDLYMGHLFLDVEEVLLLKKLLQKNNKKLVVTNGCFDLLHPGHLKTLAFAKEQGDYLLVLINSDNSIKNLKGDSRPINKADIRAEMLLNTPNVDGVLIFDGDTPGPEIEMMLPEFLVKGGDYLPENVVGYETVSSNGGIVLIAPYLPGHSTSALISRSKSF